MFRQTLTDVNPWKFSSIFKTSEAREKGYNVTACRNSKQIIFIAHVKLESDATNLP